MGRDARRAKQTWWQVLPLGPTGYGDSPYQSYSAFAGNPNLISPELLASGRPRSPRPTLANVKIPGGPRRLREMMSAIQGLVLARAWEAFRRGAGGLSRAVRAFCRTRPTGWTTSPCSWPSRRRRAAGAVARMAGRLIRRETRPRRGPPASWPTAIGMHSNFGQFLFFRQWRDAAGPRPAAAASSCSATPRSSSRRDSADVWANPQLFLLDADRRPQVVAGVPPDSFAPPASSGATRSTTGSG